MIWHHLLCDFNPCFMAMHSHLLLIQCVGGFPPLCLNMNHCVWIHALAREPSFQCLFGVIMPWYNSNFCWLSHSMPGLNRCNVNHLICLAFTMSYALHASLFWLPPLHVLDTFWHVLGLFRVALITCFMFCIVVVQVLLLASSFGHHSMLHLCCVLDLASSNMAFQST